MSFFSVVFILSLVHILYYAAITIKSSSSSVAAETAVEWEEEHADCIKLATLKIMIPKKTFTWNGTIQK